MSHFFIDRPVFASVIAILIMLAGGICALRMPVAQFPHMAPPSITLMAEYEGASAQTMQDSIAQVIEQRMVGLDNLLYLSTTSSAEGRMRMSLTFSPDVNADVAQMQVQNRLQLALPMLPESVKSQGIRVRKVSDSFLCFYAFYDPSGNIPVEDIGDFISSVVLDPLSRIDGVGEATLYASPYAMRIWLDPTRLRSYSLVPDDVTRAIKAQNEQISVGQIGGLPAVAGQELNVTLLSRAKLENIEQFSNVVIRVNPDGSAVRVRDVARVEMGLQSYTISSRYNGMPAASVGIQLAEGANAMETSKRVAAFVQRMEQYFPHGLTYAIPNDTVPFIGESLKSVVRTLLEAIVLVAGIMFLFLQSWRATLIPTLAVPIVLLGTLVFMAALGSSVNTLSLFGMVLAIGLLVDDAIVVVENTERIMHEEGLSPVEATRKSMSQITGALVGVVAVLSAVFIPMAFFPGMVGSIYREFAVTIVVAMLFSLLVALTITPPLCATLLRPAGQGDGLRHGEGFFARFNRAFETGTRRYRATVAVWTRNSGRVMLLWLVLALGAVVALLRMPTSFLPVEDQGFVNLNIFMPPGATRAATLDVARDVERYFLEKEKGLVTGMGIMLGLGPYGSRGQNVSQGYVSMKHWRDRPDMEQSAAALVGRARAHFANYRGARILFSQPPQVRGLGSASGISMQLEDQAGLGHEALVAARMQLLDAARKSPLLSNTRTSSLEDVPQLNLAIDDLKAGAFSLDAGTVNSNLQTAWGGDYVNDFVDRGRIKRVYVQGDAPYRMNIDNLRYWYVRNDKGRMVPLESIATPRWTYGPSQLERYNGVASTIIEAMPAKGVSSGDAMAELARLVAELPRGFGLEWTGLSYQESQSGSQAIYLYILAILVVFLCLAALYESWSIPLAVILVVPIGVLGALGLSSLRGLYNDVYFQVGLLAVIGLSAKNAILIVEFARTLHNQGKSLREAAVEAAGLRLRPIVMTSLAFLLGVLPLVMSNGAGANSQHAIGTGIVGGTFLATALGIFCIPVFFVVIGKLFSRQGDQATSQAGQS